MAATAVDVSPGARSAQPGIRARVDKASDWLRDIRHLPDSLLHARRRRAAQLQVLRLQPESILFICHGNICRSPYAAAAFLRACPPSMLSTLEVSSAGLIGPDRQSPQKAIEAAERRGVDLSRHRSRVVSRMALQTADLVIVMSRQQANAFRGRMRIDPERVLVLGDLDPQPIDRRAIPDPWAGADAAFEASYQRIGRCVGELAKLICRTF